MSRRAPDLRLQPEPFLDWKSSRCAIDTRDQFVGIAKTLSVPGSRHTPPHFSLEPGAWRLKPHDASAEKIFAGSEEIGQ
jgi:hypothetical protein